MAYPCGVCEYDCKSSSVECNQCRTWFHGKCVKLSTAQINHYFAEQKKPKGDKWICNRCSNEEEYTTADVIRRLDFMKQKYNKLFSKYEEQVNLNIKLQEEIEKINVKLQVEINKNEQIRLSKNVIIQGIKKQDDKEKTANIIKLIGEKLNLNIEPEISFRLGKCEKGEENLIKAILKSEEEKNALLKTQKEKKISTADLGFGYDNKIYINEEQTKEYRELSAKARKLKKDGIIELTWFKNGKLFVRKTKDSQTQIIETDDQLLQLKN
ncbi:unnamed protein product [Brassicogethes aeneus]|uniref:PHD-type domain-containing protein n=1 Tax=Brassicogethes aeneus TaxID=1431903 RepID=A0A9P0BC77_BRAAE|nr:unnamed protein product [Brassicogethes aeneus]